MYFDHVKNTLGQEALHIPALTTMSRLENPYLHVRQEVMRAALGLVTPHGYKDGVSFFKTDLICGYPVPFLRASNFVDDVILGDGVQEQALGLFKAHEPLYSNLSTNHIPIPDELVAQPRVVAGQADGHTGEDDG